MQASVDVRVKQKEWKAAAVNASNLSELQLTLGEVAAARKSGQRSVGYADQSGDMFERMSDRTTYADALHQAGEAAAALALFREAEQLQQERQPGYPRLYSLPGFRYCDLLLGQGGTAEVLERAEQTLEWGEHGYSLLSKALDQLTLGRAHLQQAVEETPPNRPAVSTRRFAPLSGEGQEQARSLSAAEGWLDQAVAGLRASGYQYYLPRALLARAALHRHTHDFTRARQDLQEVFDIAEPSGMRLHLTDWHLEMARLLLTPPSPALPPQGGQGAEELAQPLGGVESAPSPLAGEGREGGNSSEAAYHIAEAERLINETGYHRRDKELAELQAKLNQAAT
jgi:tetratricopeptide (TPR) repeat protein